MTKTKEEILMKCFDEKRYADYPFHESKEATLESMEAYAKQQSILFKEWQDVNLEDKKWENYDGHDTWINPHTREVKSTEQLYEIFKSQQ